MTDEAAPTSDDPMIGQVVNGKFRILSAIAEGGMGRVYRGEQLPLGRAVAIKVLHADYTESGSDPAFQKRFFLEASILSKLQHPNIVTVFDYGTIEGGGGACFMAMEFLPGDTLSQRLREVGAFPAQQAARIIRDIARGLREAHKAGIVHRDLKPGNIMLLRDEDGGELVKILDFGLVKLLERKPGEDLTQDNSLLGSPRYMAPEQILMTEVDGRADLYALGVMLFQLLTGKVPFEATTSVQILMKTVHEPVPPMRERAPEVAVPAVLEALARRCLEKKPEDRPASCEQFLRELKDAQRQLGWISAEDSGSHSGARPAALVRSIAEAGGKPGPEATVALRKSPSQVSAVSPASSITERAPASSRARLPIVAGIVGALAALALGGVVFGPKLFGRSTPPEVEPTPPAPVTPPVATPPPTVTPPPVVAAPFLLVLESLPAGAEIFEGEVRLGTTPMQLSIDPASVRTAPRSFTMRLAGHAPYSIVQGPSESAVRIVAPLVAEAPPATRPARPGGRKPPRTGGDDIRLER